MKRFYTTAIFNSGRSISQKELDHSCVFQALRSIDIVSIKVQIVTQSQHRLTHTEHHSFALRARFYIGNHSGLLFDWIGCAVSFLLFPTLICIALLERSPRSKFIQPARDTCVETGVIRGGHKCYEYDQY